VPLERILDRSKGYLENGKVLDEAAQAGIGGAPARMPVSSRLTDMSRAVESAVRYQR
jgi:hypothetical protein